MGMRMNQHLGLNEWAEQFVAGEPILLYTERITRLYPDERVEGVPDQPIHGSTVRSEPSGESFTGMFEDEYPLRKFTFPDGRVFYERVQADPWSSGPVFFLALQDERGRWVPQSQWTEEQIQAA